MTEAWRWYTVMRHLSCKMSTTAFRVWRRIRAYLWSKAKDEHWATVESGRQKVLPISQQPLDREIFALKIAEYTRISPLYSFASNMWYEDTLQRSQQDFIHCIKANFQSTFEQTYLNPAASGIWHWCECSKAAVSGADHDVRLFWVSEWTCPWPQLPVEELIEGFVVLHWLCCLADIDLAAKFFQERLDRLQKRTSIRCLVHVMSADLLCQNHVTVRSATFTGFRHERGYAWKCRYGADSIDKPQTFDYYTFVWMASHHLEIGVYCRRGRILEQLKAHTLTESGLSIWRPWSRDISSSVFSAPDFIIR